MIPHQECLIRHGVSAVTVLLQLLPRPGVMSSGDCSERGEQTGAPQSRHPVPSRPIPSRPVPSRPVPARPVPSPPTGAVRVRVSRLMPGRIAANFAHTGTNGRAITKAAERRAAGRRCTASPSHSGHVTPPWAVQYRVGTGRDGTACTAASRALQRVDIRVQCPAAASSTGVQQQPARPALTGLPHSQWTSATTDQQPATSNQ